MKVKTITKAPKFKRVGPGVYDSECGRFTLYRIEGLSPAAWNIEWHTDYLNKHQWRETALDRMGVMHDTMVDGAATKRDALEFFNEWWDYEGFALPYEEDK